MLEENKEETILKEVKLTKWHLVIRVGKPKKENFSIPCRGRLQNSRFFCCCCCFFFSQNE